MRTAKPKKRTLYDYALERAEYFEELSASELKVHDEIEEFAQKTVDTFDAKKNQVTSEINEYERHFAGFFALAISFIISGVLASNLGPGHTIAAKTFFTLTIITALIAALILFLEYIVTFRLFNRWQQSSEKIIQYTLSAQWTSPQDLNEWIRKEQGAIPEKSTHTIQKIEMALSSFSFTCLGMWLIERLFNPNWPIF